MNTSHVTDAEIQKYVYEKESCRMEIINHVENCSSCKAQAQIYILVAAEVKRIENPVFDFNLNDLVLSRVSEPLLKSKFSFSRFGTYLASIVFLTLLSLILFAIQKYLSQSFKEMNQFIYYGISLTALAIVVSQGIDIYRKYEEKMARLDVY